MLKFTGLPCICHSSMRKFAPNFCRLTHDATDADFRCLGFISENMFIFHSVSILLSLGQRGKTDIGLGLPSGTSRARAGPGETFSRARRENFFAFCFLTWSILVYVIFLGDGGAPQTSWGPRKTFLSLPPSRRPVYRWQRYALSDCPSSWWRRLRLKTNYLSMIEY